MISFGLSIKKKKKITNLRIFFTILTYFSFFVKILLIIVTGELMTIEEKLKQFIELKYKNLREFSMQCNIPYTTVYTILIRGIKNSSLTSILKVCAALRISADALAQGEILPYFNGEHNFLGFTELNELLFYFRANLLPKDLSLNGVRLTTEETIMVTEGLSSLFDFISKLRERFKT